MIPLKNSTWERNRLSTINRMTNHLGRPELRGFLKCRTFSVKTKIVLGNQDELFALDINQEFCVNHIYWTSIRRYEKDDWKHNVKQV